MNVKVVMLVAVILLAFQTINMSVMMMASTLYAQRGFGGATEASIALTMYTVAGVISGLVLGKIFNGLERACMPLMMITVAIGAAVVFAYYITSYVYGWIYPDRIWLYGCIPGNDKHGLPW